MNALKYGRVLALIGFAAALAGCSSTPSVTQVQKLSVSADVPYENILVIGLFQSFDTRKGLEKQIVSQLAERGIKAVGSTSMMKTTTPMERETYVAMVDKIGADALIVSHLVDVNSKVVAKDASPQATYEIRPTYYFNVWNVNLTEYVEPPFLGVEGTYVVATQVFSVSAEEAVWGIESTADFEEDASNPRPFLVFLDEAKSIVSHLARDGVIAK